MNAMSDALLRWLADRGQHADAGSSFNQLSTLAHNVRFRTLPKQVWRVEVSPEVLHSVHLPAHHDGVKKVIKDARKGHSLRGYQTTRLDNPNDNDMMLSDWGIHHLHLGTAPHPSKPKYVARTGPLLYVMAVENSLLLLDLLAHGHWEDVHLIEIVHRRFPWALEPYKLEAVSIEFDATSEERRSLRNGGVSTFTKVKDGTTYLPPGGGIASSRRSSSASQAALAMHHFVQPAVVATALRERYPKTGEHPPTSLRFDLDDDLRVFVSAAWQE